jgi:hypothetical protein
MADRTVHASSESGELVRYERAGKWYMELPDDLNDPEPRILCNLADAVAVAIAMWYEGGDIFLDQPGGKRFDAKIRKMDDWEWLYA